MPNRHVHAKRRLWRIPLVGQSTLRLSAALLIILQGPEDLLASVPDDIPPLSQPSITHSLGLSGQACAYSNQLFQLMRTLGSDDPPNAAYFLRAGRAKPREWLSYNLTVKFGKRLSRFEEHDNGVTVFFEDGTSATGCILVRADGTSSTGKPPPYARTRSTTTLSTRSTHELPPSRLHNWRGPAIKRVVRTGNFVSLYHSTSSLA